MGEITIGSNNFNPFCSVLMPTGIDLRLKFEPRREKISLRGFRKKHNYNLFYSKKNWAPYLGSVSTSYASGPEIDPLVRHILLWKFFPSSADSKRASCQIMVKEWALITGK